MRRTASDGDCWNGFRRAEVLDVNDGLDTGLGSSLPATEDQSRLLPLDGDSCSRLRIM